jgi:hypothetical protein
MRAFARSLALVLLQSACAAVPGTAAAPQARLEPKPIPPECAEAVQRAARLGEAIFFEDRMAAWATDALVAERIVPSDARIRGWVCTRGPPFTAHFLGGDDAGPYLELYRVEFDPRSRAGSAAGDLAAADARVVRVDPPQPPSDEVARMFKARQTAVGARFSRCSDRYNTVVLPPDVTGEKGWLVYLLAATFKTDVLFGGHVRRLVSLDGATLMKDEPLSKSCVSMPRPDREVYSLFVSSLVSGCPLETHVFLSLLHGFPIIVSNSGGMWQVKGRDIQFYGPWER